MRTTPPLTSRLSRTRVLAASAALGLTLGLGACTVGEGNDDESGSTPTATASESTDPVESADPGSAPPSTAVEQLVLTAEDAPEVGLQPVPADEIAGGMDALGAFTSDVRVEPERCADISKDGMGAQSEPGAMAIQAGQVGETSIAVAVTRVTDGLSERVRQVEDCPVMTVAFPLQGEEMVTETQNSLLEIDAPEGVEDFAVVVQDNSMDMMGQTIRTSNVMITGVVRGLGISVTAAGTDGPVSDEARNTAVQLFAAQAEKVRNA
ncbi:hypothetical protein [Dietzia sp. ANT_WB102]|uniref:hypothetical protein n=1 Tax=Dietzia sp. ANT_WB102 TaxID=2597345 RepID=UPI0011ED8832|nr:hypothetical protein [Dietzia sp. ANT_WB102]KAA0917847.1 hypothetical protein FQ137_00020 [Dietzia sp. ANT_WB102]